MKLPEQAKKVFDGVIFDVYQWQQPLFDGTTATFEGLKRTATIEVIATVGDAIVFAQEEQPAKGRYLTLFGGRLEEGEDPSICAKRELAEESGLTSGDWQLYKTYQAPGKIEWADYLYIARDCQKTTDTKLDPGEKITTQAVSFEEFIKTVTEEDFFIHQQFIIELLRMRLHPEELAEFQKLLFPI